MSNLKKEYNEITEKRNKIFEELKLLTENEIVKKYKVKQYIQKIIQIRKNLLANMFTKESRG